MVSDQNGAVPVTLVARTGLPACWRNAMQHCRFLTPPKITPILEYLGSP